MARDTVGFVTYQLTPQLIGASMAEHDTSTDQTTSTTDGTTEDVAEKAVKEALGLTPEVQEETAPQRSEGSAAVDSDDEELDEQVEAYEKMTPEEQEAWNAGRDDSPAAAPTGMVTREEADRMAQAAVHRALGISSERDVADRTRALQRDRYVGVKDLVARPSMGRRRTVRFPGMSQFIRSQLEQIPRGQAVARAAVTDAIVQHFPGCNRTKAGVSLEFALDRAWAQPYRKMTRKSDGSVWIANMPVAQ